MRDDFLSVAERSFYGVLVRYLGDRAIVCPKVNVADLIHVTRGDASTRQSGKNRINRKHVDFVLCHPQTMTPMAAVELDDRSHQRRSRVQRDEFLDQVFADAGLPLAHIPARRSYSLGDLDAVLSPILQKQAEPTVPPTLRMDAAGDAPLCPKCGVAMVMREAKRGAHPGGNFFGCPNFPRCRQTVQLSELA